MKKTVVILLLVMLSSCKQDTNKQSEAKIILTLEQADNLLELPLSCVGQEYPNKLNQVIGDSLDLQTPKALHPAFYGCFDWHSAVHGHWSMVKLLKEFPNLKKAEAVRSVLEHSLSKKNIAQEILYFKGKHNTSYERTYGWAWLLKLAEELHTWNDPLAKNLEDNLKPLTDLIVTRYIEFLPKLHYPIRVGEHSNTAFGLAFAWDYAVATQETALQQLIEKTALRFYKTDVDCPLTWEPSGFDFLSPCLEEAEIMSRILPKKAFKKWLGNFLPALENKNFTLLVGQVTDRTDGKLVHIDGLNFSRAWVLLTIAKNDPQYQHLVPIATQHINASLPNLVHDDYMGGHWLASFAIYALYSY